MMIAEHAIDDTAVTQELVTAAFRLGYEGRVAFGDENPCDLSSRFDNLLRQLARHIHPNEYYDLRMELQRCKDACAMGANEGVGLFNNFAKCCDKVMQHIQELAEWYQLGREIGKACWLAARECTCPLNTQRFWKCVELIPTELRQNATLGQIFRAVHTDTSAETIVAMISSEIPSECRARFQSNELPFQILYKLVTGAISTTPKITSESSVFAIDEQGTLIRSTCAETPPPETKTWYGPVEGKLKQIATWMSMDYRTVRNLHHRGQVKLEQVHRRLYRIYFKTEVRFRDVRSRQDDA